MGVNLMESRRRIMINSPHLATETSTGIATFKTDMAVPMKSCKIEFAPIQNGSGDPSPENVRPISGWTGIEAYKRGKNLFNYKAADFDYGIRNDNGTEVDDANSGYTRTPIRVKPATTYTISGNNLVSGGYVIRIYYLNSILGWISRTGGNQSNTLTFTTPSACEYIQIQTKVSGTNPETWQLELGSIATAYEPYHGQTISIDWSSSAGTIYGGYVDLVTGEVWETWAVSDLSTWMWTVVNNNRIRSETVTNMEIPPSQSTAGTFVAEQVYPVSESKNLTAYPNGIAIMRAGYWYRYFDGTNYPSGKIAYKLATPQLLTTLTPTELRTLIGTNNIWSNAGGNIEVKYWTH